MSATQTPTPAGWYRDPTGHSMLRYWSGSEWTPWVHDTTGTHPDPLRLGQRVGPEDLGHLTFLRQVFLPEARRLGYLSPREDARLEALITTMRTEAHQAAETAGASAPARPATVSPPTSPVLPPRLVTTTATTAAPAPRGPVPAAPAPPQPGAPALAPEAATIDRARRPSAFARWWQRTREAVGSDLAVHGLAYAGVLLFFIGAFGLVVFAFGDVAPALRPLAEAIIALVPFGAAALLVHRGAVVVGRALEVAGGLVLPVMVVTSFLDGVGTPPDLSGTALVVTLTVLLGLVSLAYAVWSWRYPTSALRYLVAPVAWLAVAMATLGLGPREIPSGKDVATPSAWQLAAVVLAVVASVALARRWTDSALGRATLVSAVPGLGVLSLLALLTWTAEGWTAVPALVTGGLVLLGVDLLGDRVPAAVPGVAGPLWWAVVTVGVAASTAAAGPVDEVAPVAVIATVGFLAQLERSAAAQRSVVALVVPAAGTVLALGAVWTDARWAVAAFAVLTLWAAVRRAVPPTALARVAVAFDVVAAGAPLLVLVALGQVAVAPTVLATAAGMTLLAALAPRYVPVTRGPAFWTLWADVVGAAVLGTAATGLLVAQDLSTVEQWTVVGASAALTVAAVVVSLVPAARPPVITAGATVAALWVVVALEIASLPATAAIGTAALTLAFLAHSPWAPGGRGAAASLGLTGLGLGLLLALVAPGDPWVVPVALALSTASLALTCWRGALERSPVVGALDRVRSGWVPFALTAVVLPATVWSVLDSAGLLAVEGRWSVAAVAAPLYAALTRLPVPGRVARVAGWASFGAALVAPLLATDPLTAAVALTAVPVSVILVRTDRRHPVMTWTAWTSLAPLAGLFATATSAWVDEHSRIWVTILALVTVGAPLLVGGAVADLRGRSWEPRWWPAHRRALAPATVGLAEVVTAVALAVLLPETDAGWVLAIAATALGAAAAASRVGLLAAPAVLIGWVSFALLAGEPVRSAPWPHLVVVGVLLVAAELMTRLVEPRPWWARADVPLLVAAAPVAVTAMAVSLDLPEQDWTVATVGALCIAVAVRVRRHPVPAELLGGIGTVLVLQAAAHAGSGWLALALLGLSAALTGLAVMTDGPLRALTQVGGSTAAIAAWWAATDWWGLGTQPTVDLSTALAAGITVAAAITARRRWLEPSWSLAWGGPATVLAAACTAEVASGGSLLGTGTQPSWWVTAGLAVIAVSLATGAAPVGLPWLRELSVVVALASLGIGLQAGEATSAVVVGALAVLSALAAVVLLVGQHAAWMETWRWADVVLGLVSSAWCLVVAAYAPTDTYLLVPALGAAAVQSAALGVALDQAVLRMAAPAFACGAWLAFALEALGGNPQWVTVPVGLAMLAVVGLWRTDLRHAGRDPAAPPVVALEGVGIAFLVGSSLVQTFTVDLRYAPLVSAIGLGVAAWGGTTRVRRRLVSGVVLVVLGLVLLVAVPLVRLLPAWEGPVLWVVVGGLGVALVLVATMLERGRAAVRAGTRRLRALTQGWE